MVVVVVVVMVLVVLVVVVVIGGLGGATELGETEIRGRERFEANYGKLECWFGKRFRRVEWKALCASGEGLEFGGETE